MAINNAEKRKAISGIVSTLIAGVTPNILQDADWRYEAGWSYRVSGMAITRGKPDNTLLLWQQWKMRQIVPEFQIIEV